MGCMAREFGLAPRPMPGVRPGGRPTFLCGQESRQRSRPSKTAPAGFSAMLEDPGPRKTPCVRCAHSGQTVARSQLTKRAARAPGSPALLGGFKGEAPKQPSSRNSQPPNPKAGWRRLFLHPPFEPAEQRKGLRARAQHASSTDSAQLFERSVAERVLRGPARPEQRWAARCEAKGRADRGRLFAFFLVAQKEGRPPGRTPGWAWAPSQSAGEPE